MEIEGYQAVIQFDPDIDMFRGEFIGLNGGADFYAPDVAGLRKEGATSLRVFLEMCEEDGVEPRRSLLGETQSAHVAGTARERGGGSSSRGEEPQPVDHRYDRHKSAVIALALSRPL